MLLIQLKKTDYVTKVTEIENKLNNHNRDKYIDTSEFNKLAVDVFHARLAQANLVAKTGFDAKLSGLNRKITQNKTNLLYTHKKNSQYIVYELGESSSNINDPTLKNCLFGGD